MLLKNGGGGADDEWLFELGLSSFLLSCVQMERGSLSRSPSPRMAPWEEAAVLEPLR